MLDALVKGYRCDDAMKILLTCFETFEYSNPGFPWFSRVPSQSNLGDLPSRGKWNELRKLINEYVVDTAVCPLDASELESIPQVS